MIIKFDYLIFSNLPNLQSFETGDYSFEKTESLSLSSMIIKFDYLSFSNLPKLNQISLGWYSFCETTSISLESTIEFQSFQFLDVPFNNGNYSVDNNETFHKITSSSITSDLSILFLSFIPSILQIASEPLKQAILTIRPQ